jgi:aconitate hydratase
VKANYLASPPLVVAYALAGRMDLDLTTEPLGTGKNGPVLFKRHLANLRSAGNRSQGGSLGHVQNPLRHAARATTNWNALAFRRKTIRLGRSSTYIKKPPYFDGMDIEPRR